MHKLIFPIQISLLAFFCQTKIAAHAQENRLSIAMVQVYLKDINHSIDYCKLDTPYSGFVFLSTDTLIARVTFLDKYGSCIVNLYDRMNNLKRIRRYKGSKKLFRILDKEVWDEKKLRMIYSKMKVFIPKPVYPPPKLAPVCANGIRK